MTLPMLQLGAVPLEQSPEETNSCHRPLRRLLLAIGVLPGLILSTSVLPLLLLTASIQDSWTVKCSLLPGLTPEWVCFCA